MAIKNLFICHFVLVFIQDNTWSCHVFAVCTGIIKRDKTKQNLPSISLEPIIKFLYFYGTTREAPAFM